MDVKFEQFLKERKYLQSVSPRTLEWYTQSFQWLQNPEPTEADLLDCVVRMREAGLKATSCNNRIRAINSYLKWAGIPHKLHKLKEPQLVLPVYTDDDVKRIARWKLQNPHKWSRQRAQTLALVLADTGCRISELLTLRWSGVDFDNLLLTVHGKGNKERIIPFSYELRRFLFMWQRVAKHDLVFPTSDGMMLSARNAHHSIARLLDNLGIKRPARLIHAWRHTFASKYPPAEPEAFRVAGPLKGGLSATPKSKSQASSSNAD
jgi:integrase/recombinase XerD